MHDCIQPNITLRHVRCDTICTIYLFSSGQREHSKLKERNCILVIAGTTIIINGSFGIIDVGQTRQTQRSRK